MWAPFVEKWQSITDVMACEYCEGYAHKLLVDGHALEASVTCDGRLLVEFHGAYDQELCEQQINFCPICGRDLRGDDQ